MRWDGVQGKGGLGGGEQRVAPIFRLAAGMSGHAAELHIEFGGGHKVVATAHHGADRDAGADMDGGKIVHLVHHAGGHHRAGAAGTLFSRLENQFNDAIELGDILLEHMRQPQPDGGMPIVAAGVHHAGVAGGEMVAMGAMAVIVLLIEVEGVHVDAKGQGWAGTSGVERRHHAGEPAFKRRQPAFRRPLLAGALESLGQGLLIRQPHPAVGIDDVAPQRQLVAEPVEDLRHLTGGAKLQPAGFSVQVKIAAPLGHGWRQLAQVFIK
ncbi:hypothetical protein SB00610_02113 [Klebsiella quasipneumoniae subsp. similipneumoniae]|nr:hypothetical protein SB00610_02113 [Klebsiella quasipneumoniae subsp. similipneumoniae]